MGIFTFDFEDPSCQSIEQGGLARARGTHDSSQGSTITSTVNIREDMLGRMAGLGGLGRNNHIDVSEGKRDLVHHRALSDNGDTALWGNPWRIGAECLQFHWMMDLAKKRKRGG